MIALEHLADGSVSDRNFQKLMSLVLDTGGQSVSIRFGTLTLSWTTGQTSSTVLANTPHGLGKAPTAVWVFPIATGLPAASFAQAFGLTATDFDAVGYCVSAAISNTDVLHGWVAIS